MPPVKTKTIIVKKLIGKKNFKTKSKPIIIKLAKVGLKIEAKNLKTRCFLAIQMAITEVAATIADPKATPLNPYFIAKNG